MRGKLEVKYSWLTEPFSSKFPPLASADSISFFGARSANVWFLVLGGGVRKDGEPAERRGASTLKARALSFPPFYRGANVEMGRGWSCAIACGAAGRLAARRM